MSWILCWLWACGGELTAPPVGPAAPARAPVVLITLDTTRADRIGAWGGPVATPNIDALAGRGARFSRAYATVPLTIPSHASLFTGLWPSRHGVRDNGDARLSEDATTLAERFSAAGYRTHACVGAFVTQAHWGFGQGFDGYDDDLGVPSDRVGWRAERSGDAVVDDALVALGEGADFLWVHLFDAHAPYRAPGWAPPEGAVDTRVLAYDAEIAFLDEQVGRLIAGVPDEAIVVLAGDHGEALGEGGEQQHGLLLGEGVLHVPLVVTGPGVAREVIDRTVSLVDVAPTLLRLAGLAVPAGLDGTDLFEPAPRAGVVAETLYGAHHYGWTPLAAVITDEGMVVRGARDVGEASEGSMALLDAVPALSPAWDPAPATLDLADIEQLQALGYLGSASAPAVTGVDPRDGIAQVGELDRVHALPPDEQIAALRALLAEVPEMRDARFRLALLLARMGRLDEAIAEMSTAHRLQPDSTAAAAMGSLWMQASDPGEALDWYRESLGLDPRSSAALAGEVEALVMLGRTDEAAATAEIALRGRPDDARLVVARAYLALRSGESTDPWLEPVDVLATTRPYEPRILQVDALLHGASGDTEGAIELLRTELRWRPANVAARLELAGIFREQGRLVDVVKTLRPLTSLQPDEPRWQAMTAEAYIAMDRRDLAEPHLARCQGYEGCPD